MNDSYFEKKFEYPGSRDHEIADPQTHVTNALVIALANYGIRAYSLGAQTILRRSNLQWCLG